MIYLVLKTLSYLKALTTASATLFEPDPEALTSDRYLITSVLGAFNPEASAVWGWSPLEGATPHEPEGMEYFEHFLKHFFAYVSDDFKQKKKFFTKK